MHKVIIINLRYGHTMYKYVIHNNNNTKRKEEQRYEGAECLYTIKLS